MIAQIGFGMVTLKPMIAKAIGINNLVIYSIPHMLRVFLPALTIKSFPQIIFCYKNIKYYQTYRGDNSINSLNITT